MSELTPNLGLFKYNIDTDGNQSFNINQCLNNNWDKIDSNVATLNSLNNKQNTLVSGTNIKTVNGNSLLGSGDLEIKTSSRKIGEIIQSTIPLNDAGLHLLDGTKLEYGAYKDFIDYIATVYRTYPNLFCTEDEWNASVRAYGVCGKFVYNVLNKSVILPKINGFTEGTSTESEAGGLVEAGLPNIEGKVILPQASNLADGASFYADGQGLGWAPTGNVDQRMLHIDASRSSSIYGNSSTVQPQSIKVLYYIVVANTINTDVEVDINNVMTDLNGKADRNLSNVDNVALARFTDLSFPSLRYDKFEPSNKAIYTAPEDGWFVVTGVGYFAGAYLNLAGSPHGIGSCVVTYGNGVSQGMVCNLPVKKSNQVGLGYNCAVTDFRFYYASGVE